MTSYLPVTNGYVNKVLVDGNTAYLGGSFSKIANFGYTDIAAINATSAAEFGVTLGKFSGGANKIYVVKKVDNYIYVAGNFTHYDGVARQCIAKLSLDGTLDTTFNTATGLTGLPYGGSQGGITHLEFSSDNSSIYCAGYFDGATYKGVSKIGLFKINATTAALDTTFVGDTTQLSFSRAVAYTKVDPSDSTKLYVFFQILPNDPTANWYGNINVVGNTHRVSASTGLIDYTYRAYFRWPVYAPHINNDALYFSTGRSQGDPIPSGYGIKTYDNTVLTDNLAVSTTLNLSRFNGPVTAVFEDGGYYYVGGNFTKYDNTTRNYLAKINASTGELDATFDPGVSFGIPANLGSRAPASLVVVGGYLYASGNFQQYQGAGDSCVFKINTTTAARESLDWKIAFATYFVLKMKKVGSKIYFYRTGTIAVVDTAPPNNVAAERNGILVYETSNNTFGSFKVSFTDPGGGQPTVEDLIVDGNYLYACGAFPSVTEDGGSAVSTPARVVKFDMTGNSGKGSIDNTFLTNVGNGGLAWARSITTDDGSNFWITFDGTSWSGQTRYRIVKIGSNGTLDASWATSDLNGNLSNVVFFSDAVFVSGNVASRIYKLNKTTGATTTSIVALSPGAIYPVSSNLVVNSGPVDIQEFPTATGGVLVKADKTNGYLTTSAHLNGHIYTSAESADGNYLYIGGNFNKVGAVSKSYLAKISLSDLTNQSWNSSGPNSYVISLSRDGKGGIFISGNFESYGAVSRQRLCKISESNGTLDTTFVPSLMGSWYETVRDLQNTYADGMLVIWASSGDLEGVSPTSVDSLARCNITTGAIDTTWTPVPNVYPNTSGGVYDLIFNPDKSSIYVAGGWGLRKFSTSTGAYQTHATTSGGSNGTVITLATDGNYLYVGGYFASIQSAGGGTTYTRNYLAKVDMTNDSVVTAFNTSNYLNNYVQTLAVYQSKVYVGGRFDTYNSATHSKIVKLNETDATVASGWDSGSGFDNWVQSLYVSSSGVFAGGRFYSYNSTTRRLICKLDTDGTLDATFNSNATETGGHGVKKVIMLDSDLYVAAPYNLTLNGTAVKGVAKLSATTGARNATFDTVTSGVDGASAFPLIHAGVGMVFVSISNEGAGSAYKGVLGQVWKVNSTDASVITTTGTGLVSASSFTVASNTNRSLAVSPGAVFTALLDNNYTSYLQADSWNKILLVYMSEKGHRIGVLCPASSGAFSANFKGYWWLGKTWTLHRLVVAYSPSDYALVRGEDVDNYTDFTITVTGP